MFGWLLHTNVKSCARFCYGYTVSVKAKAYRRDDAHGSWRHMYMSHVFATLKLTSTTQSCRHYADTPALHAESSVESGGSGSPALLARVCRPRRLFLLASLTYKSFSLVFPSACALLAWHDIMP